MKPSPSIVPETGTENDIVAWLLREAAQQERIAARASDRYGADISASTANNLRRAAAIIQSAIVRQYEHH